MSVAFKARSHEFRFQTLFAQNTSAAQLKALIEPTTRTPIRVLVAEMMSEIRIGAMSLHVRSILRITEFRCVRSYAAPSGAAAVTTQSRSMESMFPEALRASRIPRIRMSVNIPPFRINGTSPLPASLFLRASGDGESRGVTMKYHRMEAPITATRLIEMVLKSVFSRLGLWSTHLPTIEEKHINARVRTMPLPSVRSAVVKGVCRPFAPKMKVMGYLNIFQVTRIYTYRIAAAVRVSGYAAAVKMIYLLMSLCPTSRFRPMIRTAANS